MEHTFIPMGSKLYIGNLSFNTTEAGLKEHFGQAGSVASVELIQDKFTGRSRGFGFVTMGSDQEAQAAVEQFHGKELDGRALTVNEARPKEERGGGGGGGGYRGGGGGGGGYRGREGGGGGGGYGERGSGDRGGSRY